MDTALLFFVFSGVSLASPRGCARSSLRKERHVAPPTSARNRRLARNQHRGRTRLQVELLESRDLPSAINPGYIVYNQGGGATPLTTAGPIGYTPAQLRQAYGINDVSFNGTAATGAGTTIAIVDAYDDPNIATDLKTFDAAFGLPNPTLTKVNQTGGSTLPVENAGWDGEIALDVEWAHAIAPGANILLVEATNQIPSDLEAAAAFAATQPNVAVVSMSWGFDETSSEKNTDADFLTPSGHQGVTFVAAAGDNGASDLPGDSPNVVSVGGTTLNLDANGNITSETGWIYSGGGVSAYETQPSFQKGVVTQSTTMRTNPDVSLDADEDTGVAVCDSINNSASAPWDQIGGTSIAAPQWAAIIDIADQGRILNGLSTLNGATQTLPALYSLPSVEFHDITSGTSLGSPQYSAGPGYDLVTGLGTPVANLLIPALVGLAVASSTPAQDAYVTTPPSSYTILFSSPINASALQASDFTVNGSFCNQRVSQCGGHDCHLLVQGESRRHTGSANDEHCQWGHFPAKQCLGHKFRIQRHILLRRSAPADCLHQPGGGRRLHPAWPIHLRCHL